MDNGVTETLGYLGIWSNYVPYRVIIEVTSLRGYERSKEDTKGNVGIPPAVIWLRSRPLESQKSPILEGE